MQTIDMHALAREITGAFGTLDAEGQPVAVLLYGLDRRHAGHRLPGLSRPQPRHGFRAIRAAPRVEAFPLRVRRPWRAR